MPAETDAWCCLLQCIVGWGLLLVQTQSWQCLSILPAQATFFYWNSWTLWTMLKKKKPKESWSDLSATVVISAAKNNDCWLEIRSLLLFICEKSKAYCAGTSELFCGRRCGKYWAWVVWTTSGVVSLFFFFIHFCCPTLERVFQHSSANYIYRFIRYMRY